MAVKAGVWIDHKKAIVVLLTDAGQEIKKFKSGIEQPVRPSSSSRPKHKYTPNDFIAEDRREGSVLRFCCWLMQPFGNRHRIDRYGRLGKQR
jgi:hypothetical protein